MEQTNLSAVSSEEIGAFLKEFAAAAKKLTIYPPGHPAAVNAADRPFSQLRELLAVHSRAVLSLAEGTLVANGIPLDSRYLQDGLGRLLLESGLQSIAFEEGLRRDEFDFLLDQMVIKKEQRLLEKGLSDRGIAHITVGKLTYQLVADDEVVISKDAALETGEIGGRSDEEVIAKVAKEAEHTLLDVIRKCPQLLLQIIARRFGGTGGLGSGEGTGEGTGLGGGSGTAGDSGGGSGGGTGSGTHSGVGLGGGPTTQQTEVESFQQLARTLGAMMPFGGSGSGSGRGFGSGDHGPAFSEEDYVRLKQAFSEVSNEELIGLLVSALKLSLQESPQRPSKVEITHTLSDFRELLKEREALDLLPRLRSEIEQLQLIDNDYLRELLAADASPKKIAHLEIENFKSEFFYGNLERDSVDDLLGWLETINDRQYTDDFVSKLFEALENSGYELTTAQHEALLRFASLSADRHEQPIFGLQVEEIIDRLSQPDITLKEFQLLSELLERYYLKYIDIDLYGEASRLLDLIVQRMNLELIFAEGIAEYAETVHRRLTSGKLAELLVGKLRRDFELIGKPMLPLLQKFNNLEAILVFAGFLNDSDRGVRVFLIRILSEFGESTIRAFELMLADKTLLARPAGEPLLPLLNWYRIRNIIFILGNIQHPDSIDIISTLVHDDDPRVVLESLIALEKLGGPKSAATIAKLLSHPEREIHHKALNSLAQIGVPEQYPELEEYFLQHLPERQTILPVLIRLDRQRALSFLAAILLEESENYEKHHSKPDEDLNELIVRTFSLLRTAPFDDVLRKYVAKNTRSLFGQWRRAESVRVAERYLKTLPSA